MELGNLLMLADIAKLVHEEGAYQYDFSENEVDLLSSSAADAYDHCYLPSNDFERVVNSTHDYYHRVEQWDLGEQEHSYAFQIPFESTNDGLLTYDDSDSVLEPSTSYTQGIVLNPHECQWEDCSASFGTLRELQTHAEGHLQATTRFCGWRGCKKSSNRYAHRYLLSRHLRSHTGATPFACEHCGNQFATKERMRLHIRAIHLPEVKYKCEECDRFFKTTSERRHHMSRIHMKERLQCGFCGGLYAGSAVLRRHLKVCKRK
ncbi:hypothetical protein KIN20_023090 [Parelaphostrongylus tenuis]|uniref:C2H2-type domain-containing protein n=1 Tax=Parelaphostrongylus tenuis TaxID=148309 RepID=A0AAD5N6S3_PARTN|nr:hypothetical protein KIN20_023090 [Parelaphostrongylus tenuis]